MHTEWTILDIVFARNADNRDALRIDCNLSRPIMLSCYSAKQACIGGQRIHLGCREVARATLRTESLRSMASVVQASQCALPL